jgi:trehalose 6-phosphate phosphatase
MTVKSRNKKRIEGIPATSEAKIATVAHSSVEAFASSFEFSENAILLDIDGTLLDLAPTPGGVNVPPTLPRHLRRLCELVGGALALVSGRPLSDLDRIFGPAVFPAIGGHGAEIRPGAKADLSINRDTPLLEERMRRALVGLGGKGVLVEDKGYSIALHYRRAPEYGPELSRAVDAIVSGLPSGSYEVLPGKAVIEVKPTGFNKGTAVLELMQLPPFAGRRPLFIGDDITDEAVFAILPEVEGTGLSVGREIEGAKGMFESPADVREWLRRLAKRDNKA